MADRSRPGTAGRRMSPPGLLGPTGHVARRHERARAPVIFAYGPALVRAAGRGASGGWPALDTIVSAVVGSNLSRTRLPPVGGRTSP